MEFKTLISYISLIGLCNCSSPICPEPVNLELLQRCSNGLKDGNEKGIDCGGDCAFICLPSTVILQPGPGEGIDGFVNSKNQAGTFSNKPLQVITKVDNSEGYSNHCFLNFNYSAVPSSANILRATLTLFADTTTTADYANRQILPGHSGENKFTLAHITKSWDDKTINWTNQPGFDYSSNIELPTSTSRHQAYVIDVTAIVKKEFVDGQHYGFRLVNTRTITCAAVFYSSEGKYPHLRPKLALEYTY